MAGRNAKNVGIGLIARPLSADEENSGFPPPEPRSLLMRRVISDISHAYLKPSSFMNRALTILLTALLLAHGALGCCWHHAHASESGCCQASSFAAAACGCDSHDEDGHRHVSDLPASLGDSSEPQPAEHGHHECDGDECTFTLTRASLDFSLAKVQHVAMADVPACMDLAIITVPNRTPSLAAPGQRLHVVLAVLLI